MLATAIDYDADGMRMVGRLAVPDGDDHRPAVLIAHRYDQKADERSWREMLDLFGEVLA